MTHSHAWHLWRILQRWPTNSLICGFEALLSSSRLIHKCDMTHSYTWHLWCSFADLTHELSHLWVRFCHYPDSMFEISHPLDERSTTYVTWLIYMCHSSFICAINHKCGCSFETLFSSSGLYDRNITSSRTKKHCILFSFLTLSPLFLSLSPLLMCFAHYIPFSPPPIIRVISRLFSESPELYDQNITNYRKKELCIFWFFHTLFFVFLSSLLLWHVWSYVWFRGSSPPSPELLMEISNITNFITNNVQRPRTGAAVYSTVQYRLLYRYELYF